MSDALPPLPEHELRPFLHGIQLDPDDDLAIRALGDWLEEMGDVRADLVRAGLFGDLTGVRKWRQQYGPAWWGEVPPGVQLEVRRGLIEVTLRTVLISAVTSLHSERLTELFRQGWVFRVIIDGAFGARFAEPVAELLHHVTAIRWDQALDGRLKQLPPLPRLRELDLSKSREFGAAGLEAVGRFPGLWRLHLAGCEEIERATLADLRELRHLRLSWNPRLTSATLNALPELRSLSFGMCDTFRELWTTGLPSLRELSLRRCVGLRDADLAGLAGLGSLESLDLHGCALTGAGLAHLAGLSRLRELDLSECRGLDLSRVPDLPALQLLDVRGTRGGRTWAADLARLRENVPLRVRRPRLSGYFFGRAT